MDFRRGYRYGDIYETRQLIQALPYHPIGIELYSLFRINQDLHQGYISLQSKSASKFRSVYIRVDPTADYVPLP